MLDMISNAHDLRRMDRKVVDEELCFILRVQEVWGSCCLCSMIIYDCSDRLYRSDFIQDVKTISEVNGQEMWMPAYKANITNFNRKRSTSTGRAQQRQT